MAGKKAGRKSKAEEMGLKALLDKCWTRQARENCIKALAEKAAAPSDDDFMDATKLLMAYTFGKPTETIQATVTHRDYEVEIGGNTAGESEGEPQFVN